MIGGKKSKLGDGWRHFWQKSVSLLAAPSRECVFCGARVGGERNALELCGACYRGIPWIKDVQCAVCGRYETCHDCKRRTDAAFLRSRSAVRYDERMKDWLARFKYRGDERLSELFSRMLLHGYRKLLETDGLLSEGFDLITYVPLNEERHLERGFNQAERLARLLGESQGLPVALLLKRVRNTSKQSFKTRSERLEDMKGVFQFDAGALSASDFPTRTLRILIVDDVYTTGSTLQQCALAISGHLDAAVYGLSWAR